MRDKMILGVNVVYSTDCSQTGLNNNVLVCGASGCGKTMSITEARLLETFHSCMIATVTKRRIVEKYKPVFRRRGYIVEDLNFINPSESDVAYDPLEYINSYADIRFLAESIVKADPQKDKSNADPYWDHAAISLLSAEIAYILMTEENPTFIDVLELHDRITFEERSDRIETSLDTLFDILEKTNPGSFAVSCWKSFMPVSIRRLSVIMIFGKGSLLLTKDSLQAKSKQNYRNVRIFISLRRSNGKMPVYRIMICFPSKEY